MSLSKVAWHYERAYRNAPMLTLAGVNGVLAVIGDATAQVLPMLLSAPTDGFDASRSFRYWLFGTLMGPVGGKWNEFLEETFPLHPKPHRPLTSSPHVDEKQAARSHVIGMTAHSPPSPSKSYPKSPRPLSRGTAEKLETGEKGKDEPPPSRVAVLKRLACDQLLMAPLSLVVFLFYMSIMEGLDWPHLQERFSRHFLSILRVNWQVWPFIQLFNFRYLPLRYRVPFTAACGILWTVFLSFSTRPAAPVPASPVAAPAPTAGGEVAGKIA